MRGASIGFRLEELDARRFVGRTRELAELEALLTPEPVANVALVHGPGGIGKSALLRELTRRARRRDWTCAVVEARDLPDGTDGIDARLRALGDVDHALIVFDSWEHAAHLGAHLRTHVLPAMPSGWVAVVAGRDEPDTAWVRDGWEHLSRELALAPLDDDDALECLRRHGVDDDARAARLVAWAAGSPLALVLGARTGATWEPASPAPDEVIGPLVRRVIDVDVDDVQLAVLATAAFARITTTDLLRAAVPAADPAASYEWLATRPFAEPLGAGVALHALFAGALREYVVRHHAVLAHDLRRRIADHAYVESIRNREALSYDLASLVDDPVLRWGYGWDRTGRHRLDQVRNGDIDALESALAAFGSDITTPWSRLVRRYFEEAPELVVVVRDGADALAGFSLSASTRVEPPFADDFVLVPWLADARVRAGSHDAVVWTVSTVLGDEAAVRPLLGFGGISRAGVANPRLAYLPIDPAMPAAVAFSASLAGQHLPELDVMIDGKVIECHVVDFGPTGLLGAQRAVVYRELGLVPAELVAVVDGDIVRALLRDFARADRLAASSLASGATVAERAASVRALVYDAMDRALGDNPHDERLREVLRAGYLERTESHEKVAASLHVSRAVYFRLAREAVERLAHELASAIAAPGAA